MTRNRRVVALVADWGGCGYYRMCLPIANLGPGVDWWACGNEAHAMALAPDTVMYQRVGSPALLTTMKMHKAAGRRIVMDFDDNLHALPHSNPVASMYGTGKPATVTFEEALRTADVVTCSTPGLRDEYASIRPGIRVIPNAVSPEHVKAFDREYTGAPKRAGEIRIGYAGSPTHAADLDLVTAPLKAILAKYPQARVVTVGQQHPLSTEHHDSIMPAEKETPPDFILRCLRYIDSMDFDIAIAPLQSNTFNRCKSAVKLLEYGIVGVPVVASHFGPYALYEGVISNAGQWEPLLSALIESDFLRATFATENYAWIAEHGTIASTAAAWSEALL